ncbi:hypothetical protein P9990_26340 (plasmid) [Prescottella equi]|uniref:hypothetical protein n=1 Tax=Rhodococcus hoagii TaxID=43767 RepID=UPI002574901B|nr:hypothetical protein [Prescottella equi]WJJ14335.1 hypothetical protein P9990_26340 [Prescottella equi]
MVASESLCLCGATSVGFAALHLIAAELHTEHVTLDILLVVLATAQCAAGLLALISTRKTVPIKITAIGMNIIAVGSWPNV